MLYTVDAAMRTSIDMCENAYFVGRCTRSCAPDECVGFDNRMIALKIFLE